MLHNLTRERAQKRLNHMRKKRADLLRERDRLNAEAAIIDCDNPRLLAAAADTPEHTETHKSDQCPLCLEDYKENQTVMMNRCGHSVCLPCANDAVDDGNIMKCTICLGSETLKAVQFKPEPDSHPEAAHACPRHSNEQGPQCPGVPDSQPRAR